MACCFIIFLYVQDELSYDAFHEKADRIYRVDQTNIWANFEGRFASTGPGVAKVLSDALPEIETIVRVNNPADWLVTVDDASGAARYFEEPRVLAADSTFFRRLHDAVRRRFSRYGTRCALFGCHHRIDSRQIL